jgi:ribosomal protein S18 acetylase RimI-like enzyme
MLRDLRPRLHEPAVRDLLAPAVGFPTPERMEWTCACYRQPGWHLLGLEHGGQLVGLIGLEATTPGQAVVRHIAVLPAERRQGHGRALIARAAVALGLTCLEAETDAEAVDFYRRCGFAVQCLGEKYPGVERFRCTACLP